MVLQVLSLNEKLVNMGSIEGEDLSRYSDVCDLPSSLSAAFGLKCALDECSYGTCRDFCT